MKFEIRNSKPEVGKSWRETVETVAFSVAGRYTSLKRGVNETKARSFRGGRRGVNETKARAFRGGRRESPITGHQSLITDYESPVTSSGFTMIEIAISLAVIGFALVAIIGILPQGMTVQKENRQETIINQDANMFLEAIRNGGRGFDDLTNYVMAITNAWSIYNAGGTVQNFGVDGYTYARAYVNNAQRDDLVITNGLRIVGLLSMPRYIDLAGSNGPVSFRSNYVVAYVRSMSGQAGEKYPQTNSMMREMAFGYKLMPEIAAYSYFEPDWTNYGAYLTSVNTNDWIMRSNYFRLAATVQTNLYDLRLTFRWPLFPNGNVGNDRQIFRTAAGGRLWQTNDLPNNSGMPVWFFEPRTYVKASIP